jgi:hypothetical protein
LWLVTPIRDFLLALAAMPVQHVEQNGITEALDAGSQAGVAASEVVDLPLTAVDGVVRAVGPRRAQRHATPERG